MGFFDSIRRMSEEDTSTTKVRNLLEHITETIRMRFTCQVLPPEIIPGEKWKTGNQTEVSVIDFVRVDNNWSIEEFEGFLRTKKVYVCSVHV